MASVIAIDGGSEDVEGTTFTLVLIRADISLGPSTKYSVRSTFRTILQKAQIHCSGLTLRFVIAQETSLKREDMMWLENSSYLKALTYRWQSWGTSGNIFKCAARSSTMISG